jgi:hypothetical protein
VRKDAEVMLASSAKSTERCIGLGMNSFVLIEFNRWSRDSWGTGCPGSAFNTGSSRIVTDKDVRDVLARRITVRTAARISSRSARDETEKIAEAFGRLSA